MNKYSIKTYTRILLIACLTAMSGCKDNFGEYGHEESAGLPINVSGTYNSQTRASDLGFADKDVMGIFISDYSNDKPASLESDDLHASNVKFTYSEDEGKWNGSTHIYWKDGSTPIDIYGYYPFESSLTAPRRHQFSVATRQSVGASPGVLSAYEQSDFLWAKTCNVKPTAETISLEYRHAMGGITIRLEAGSGFDMEEFSKVEKIVWIDNTVPQAVIDLEAQTVVVGEGERERIYPLSYNSEYRAVVVPQSVEAGKCVIGLNVDGRNYQLTKDSPMNYQQGKMHTFTVRIDRKSDSGDYEFSLLPETITAWTDDPDFHDGIMYQYMIVNVSEPGTLKETMKDLGMDWTKITALKVCGPLNEEDRFFIGLDMPLCSAVNLADAIMTDDILSLTPHYMSDGPIRHLVYPTTPFKKLYNVSGFLRGNQIIPEGVEEIDGWTAAGGTQVSFPSTLKRIGEIGTDLRGEINLPEGLESFDIIRGHFTGSLHLPESLKKLGHVGGNFTGGLVIPQGIKSVHSEAFAGCKFSGPLELPVGLEVIGGNVFGGCGFTGELVLPESVKEIEGNAFAFNKFTTIIWPEDLSAIGWYAFQNCDRLQGTIVIPNKVRVINEGTFQGCSLITGLELHEDIDYIGREAFAGCERLTSISCKAETPPLVSPSAFNGVGLDHVVLEVPASSLAAYKTAPGWKEFKRISAYKDFSCYPSQVQALNRRKSQTVVLSAKGEWKLGAKPDWCTVSPDKGTGKTQVTITVSDLSAGAGFREGKVEFVLSDGSAVAAVEVSQHDYAYEEDSAVMLQKHTSGNGIPVYFVADGWNGNEIASGEYLERCKEDMEHFFGIAPYDRLRGYFDVYSIMSLSQESGVNTVYTYRDTKFSTIYVGGASSASCGGSNSQLLPDESLIFDYLKNDVSGVSITDDDLRKGLTILIPNALDYASVTYYYDGDFTISICPPTTNPYPMDNRGVIQHEACGHGFGKLGDELIVKNQFAPAGITGQIESMHGKEWYMNLATTSNMNTVPWAHMIFNPRYSDRVDVFEGGSGFTRGVFRSEANSCMNLGIPYFNSISRQYITKRILEIAGEGFDIDSFFDNDSFAWGNTAQTRSMESEELAGIPDHKAPVMMSASESRNLIRNARNQQQNNIKK